MRLSKSNTSVDEQRIAVISGIWGDSQSCCMGKFIVFTNDESVKCVIRIQRFVSNDRRSRFFLRLYSLVGLNFAKFFTGRDMNIINVIKILWNSDFQRLFELFLYIAAHLLQFVVDENGNRMTFDRIDS